MKLSLFSEYKGLRKELYVLFIGQIMTNMGAMIWPMFTLILNQKLGLSAGTIAVCMTVYSLAAIPIGLIGGKLADKFNKKKIILVCDTISILSYLYCWIVPLSIPSILIFAIASLFQSAESPSYAALVADFTGSADRERAYSLSYLGSNLGLMLAPTLGGLLFNRYLSIAFLINGLAIASSTLLIGFFIRNVEKEPDDHPESVYEKEIDHQISAFSYLLKNRVLLLMLLVTALYATVYAMFNYLMPLDLVSANGDKGSVLFGTMTSVNCVVVVLLTAPITRLFRRISDIGKTGIGQALIGFGYLIFVLFLSFPSSCYLAILIFTIGEIFDTLASTPFWTRRIPSSHRGRILSIVNVFSNLFSSVSLLFVGKVYDRYGSYGAWGLIFFLCLVNLLLLAVVACLDKKDYPFLSKKRNKQEGNLEDKIPPALP